MAFVRIVGLRMMCLSMALQAVQREAPRPERQKRAIDAPGSRCENPAFNTRVLIGVSQS